MLPNLFYEKRLIKKGFKYIVGVDEVGRGAWAGPLVATAVLFKPELKIPRKKLAKIKDSKQLTPKKREEIFEWLVNFFDYGIGKVTERTIDRIGLGPANKLAMFKAIESLKIKPDYLLIDGFKLNYKNIPSQGIIAGDARVLIIAAASIIAKVSRDRLMRGYHQKFPQYNFWQHKGYGTREHYRLICRNGICKLHRRSFRPMKELVKN